LIIQSVDAANAPPPTVPDAHAVLFRKDVGRHSRRPPPQKKRKNVRRKLKRKAVRAATYAEQLGDPADAPEDEEAPDEADGPESPTTENYCHICQLELSGGEAYAEHLLAKSHVNCEKDIQRREQLLEATNLSSFMSPPFSASSTEQAAAVKRKATSATDEEMRDSGDAASSGDQFPVGSPNPDYAGWSKHQDVWSNVEKVQTLMPRLAKIYHFEVEDEVGDDDTLDDPLCMMCCTPNIGTQPYCSNCKSWTGGCPNLEAMQARFTAGAHTIMLMIQTPQ
jgi:hypothetical protein